ncbi:MAG: SMC-Scp complex subunit ScpB [Clostridiales bacterium]|jgi:segregation and condensation protein B|nr:SMC-Scp complex subunit ScpB [Clostridiales bacterium]
MDENKIMGLIESILFVSGESVSLRKMADFFDMDKSEIEELMEKLVESFNSRRGGLQIIKMNDRYQLATRPEYGDYIDRYFGIDKKQSLSQAMLETLSIIAYKQPITRIDIESIRGVKCEYTLGVLNDRGLIKEVGKMDAPGKPILYGTTDTFLKVFGLTSLDDLPPLTE